MLCDTLQNTKARKMNPCAAEVERVTNAMEAADYSIRPLWKYVRDMQDCYEKYNIEDRKTRASTLYYLSQYLDRQKNKKK